ncbi:MAG: hypothetical protein RL213_495 [Bacteroidota bacterium]|jgi:hypothetical protein
MPPTETNGAGIFRGRKLVIATMHRKEDAIAPSFLKMLGVEHTVPTGFDTDELGTFTGERIRTDDPLTAARTKCQMAMDLCGIDLGVASEGSFGPHPYLIFVPADEEILVFKDRKNDIEVVHREISTETNFSGADIKDPGELEAFAAKAGFPEHGLILRNGKELSDVLEKGINSTDRLYEVFHRIRQQFGNVYVETDMRAMFNPTRMKVIERATTGLLEKIVSCCPGCGWPGFTVKEVKEGLPCGDCGSPTRSTLALVSRCNRCNHLEIRMNPHDKSHEDPMYCDHCNP